MIIEAELDIHRLVITSFKPSEVLKHKNIEYVKIKICLLKGKSNK